MDCEQFIKYFITTNSLDSICHGFQQSMFNPNIDIYKLFKKIISTYEYSDVKCQQSGIPIEKRVPDKNPSYCTDTDIRINNILTIFCYEFVKYVMIKTNGEALLSRLGKNISADDNFVKLKNHFNLWIKIYRSSGMYIDNWDKFNKAYKKTLFYGCHKVDSIDKIFESMGCDIDSKCDKTFEFLEVKKMTMTLFELILKCSSDAKTINLFTLGDLIIDIKELDVGYNGSFFQMANDLYESCPDNSKFIDAFGLRSIINTDIVPNLSIQFDKLLMMIQKLQPEYTVILDNGLKQILINIIIDFYISFSINLAETYNNMLSFEKTNRIHFKTLFGVLVTNKVKYSSFEESQKTLLHYALLIPKDIAKAIKITTAHMIEDGEIKE